MSNTSLLNVKGHCPHCGPNRNANIIGSHTTEHNDDDAGIWVTRHHRLLVCRGCDNPYLQIEEVFSENIDQRQNPDTGEWERYIASTFTYWPPPSRRERPKWFDGLIGIDDTLSSLISDLYGALNADLRVPAAIAARTVFERAAELLSIEPTMSFGEKLTLLVQSGKIGEDDKIQLGILIDAGNAAAHRGWRPTLKQLDDIISLLEAFLHRSLVLDKAAQELKNRIPAKQKRQKP